MQIFLVLRTTGDKEFYGALFQGNVFNGERFGCFFAARGCSATPVFDSIEYHSSSSANTCGMRRPNPVVKMIAKINQHLSTEVCSSLEPSWELSY